MLMLPFSFNSTWSGCDSFSQDAALGCLRNTSVDIWHICGDLAVLKGQPQNDSTELESLLYSMLIAATKGSYTGEHTFILIHQHVMQNWQQWLLRVRSNPWCCPIDGTLLKCIARRNCALFFVSRACLQGVQVTDPIAAIHQGHADVYEI